MAFFRIFKRRNIRLSIEILILSSVIYYALYIYLIKGSSNFCKVQPSYCIEFLPYGDFLACYIAIVGLFFVVTSLDAWKEQHLFTNAKENLTRITKFEDAIMEFNKKISDLQEDDSQNQRKKFLAQNFNRYLKDTDIEGKLKELELHTIDTSENLYQEKFESIMTNARKLITGSIEDFNKLEWENLQKEHDNTDIGKIQIRYFNNSSLYSSELAELKKLLNKKLK